jgi:hypothetical protein
MKAEKWHSRMGSWGISVGSLFIFGAMAFGEPVQGTCEIQFVGTSTLHDFHGSVSNSPFELNFQKSGDTNYSVSGILTAAVVEMNTGNIKRDKKMRLMFEETTYPLISVDVGNLIIPAVNAEPLFVRNIDLTIRNKKLNTQVFICDCQITEESISFNVEFSVSLAAFELKPPNVFGLIKVGDTVDVIAFLDFDLHEPSREIN